MKKLLLLLTFFSVTTIKAQLLLDNTPVTTPIPIWSPNKSPFTIVTQDLVGLGVTPLNIKFNGSSANALIPSKQVDKFSTNFNLTNLGFLPNLDANGIRIFDNSPKGMILSTGETTVALGPNNSNNKSIDVPAALTYDMDLDAITTGDVKHVSIIEFDFVATGSELNFDFIFASEEYPEYSLSPAYNDVFGFFLSGPGISGPYSGGAKNIALVPNTTTPISIFNVNNGTTNSGPCVNCTYYINNGTGTTPLINTSIQYDGFTKVIRANSTLQCGQTYHIKLAIGNVGDNLFDSAVFLKNFSIPPLDLETTSINNNANTGVCFGQEFIISSGIPLGTNTFNWYLNGSTTPITGQNAPSLSVITGGTYELIVTTISGCVLAQDDILITYLSPLPTSNPVDLNICTLLPAPYIFNINQNSTILNTQPSGNYNISYYDETASNQDIIDGNPIGLIPNSNLNSYSVTTLTKTIRVRIEDLNGAGCIQISPVILSIVASPSGSISYTGSPFCSDDTTIKNMTGSITSGGVYSSTPAGLSLNTTSGAINPSLSTIGIYTVNYDLAASGTCAAYSSPSATVEIKFCVTCNTTASNSGPICPNATFNLFTTNAGTGAIYAWTGPNGFTSTDQNPLTVPAPTGAGPYIYNVSATISGITCATSSTTLVVNPSPIISGTLTACIGSSTALNSTNNPALTNPWISSNTAVASITSVGVVTGVSVGSTVITYTDSNGCTDTKTVTISTQPIISGTFSACSNGATQLSATTLPNGINPWLSSNTTVATVNNTGLISGVSAGTTVITYTNSNGCQDNKTITINALPTISGSPMVCLGSSTQLTGTPTPATLNPWTTSNTTIATVNNTGLVNGIAIGTATITYTNINGCQDTEIITVNPLPVISGVPSACVNQTTTLTATNLPATSLPWTSSNTAIATITNLGIVSGVSSGSATITYTDANGCQNTQLVTINVLPIISGVASTCANGTTQLLATTLPAALNAWISSNIAVATINNTGLVTAVTAGTTTITYTNINGCVDTEIVTINPLPIISGTLSVCIANTTQLLASTAPALSNPWMSSNTALATISSTGLVTGVATGTITITYTNSNGCMDTESVIVKTQPTAIITLLSASPICSGTTAPSVSVSGTANATVTYAVNGTNATIVIPASGTVALPTASLMANTTYQLISVTDACTKLLSQSVNVVVTSAPSATISYLKTSFCKSEGLQNVTQTGTSSGTYSVNIIGLSINTTTGAITPTTSAIGNYIVTYTVAPFGGCPLYTTQVAVEIKAGASATINYGNSYFCKSAPGTAIVTQTGSSGGTYSALPTGLIINTTTGEITPNSSNPNTYTIKYTIAAAGGCSEYSTTTTVIIENVPQFVLPQNGFVCVDPQTNLVTNTYTLNTGLSSTAYTFQWYTISTTGVQSDIAGATLNTYEVNTYVLNQLYGVLVTDTKGCFRKENAPITKSSQPNTIAAITSTYFADIQTVTVNASPNGDYEYQIDNGGYQDSNIFQNVAPGNHVIEVRDRKQCGVLAIDVFIIDYPHFFTPNGDGFNDTWNISSLNNQPNAKINIFDRLGKLIKQIVPAGNGWNGTFNGADLPATDYWFTIQYTEDNINKEFKSHFALKR